LKTNHIRYWFSKKKLHDCGDREIEVFKKATDAIPMYIRTWSGDLDTTVKSIENIEGSFKAKYSDQLTGISKLIGAVNQEFLAEFIVL